MTDKERLIELMIEAKRTDPKTGSFTDYLADYLLEHGVIVLPCKVGDTVYSYDEYLCALLDYRINRIIFSDSFSTIYSGVCFNEDVVLSDLGFEESDIGKTVFLTREEAEQALKERDGA